MLCDLGVSAVKTHPHPTTNPESKPKSDDFTHRPHSDDKNRSTFFSIPSITYSYSRKILHTPVLLFNQERILFK
jgi:hypothetical protein